MPTIQFLWRWLRLPVAILAVPLFGLIVWVAWLLSDQRYQRFLTQQLSTLLAADVQVTGSHVSLRRGLGVEFEGVTVREYPTALPLVTADAITILLDVSSLFYGQVLFRQVEIIKPHLRVVEGETQEALVRRLRGEVRKQPPAEQEPEGWFAPTFTLQQLTLDDGTITYRSALSSAPFLFTRMQGSFSFGDNKGIEARLETALGRNGELGKVTLHTSAPGGDNHIPFSQREWQGEVSLTGTRVHQVGQALGVAWPQAILDFAGRYQGKWTGPLELTGLVGVRDARVGAVRINHGSVRLEKLHWPGPPSAAPASPPVSVLSTMEVRARIEEIHGAVGDARPPVVLRQGALTLRNKELIVTDLRGAVGAASVQAQGKIQDYLSPQRNGEIRFTFSEMPDQTVAPLLPEGFVLAHNGTLSGEAKLVLSPGKEMQTSGAVTLREVQLDPLTFLRPFTVAAGELTWQGRSGTFTVTQGQLAGAAFTGRGQFSSVTPLRLEFSADFPTLNLEQAVAVDAPRTNDTGPKTTTTIVRADFTCGECTYKTLQVEGLRLAVHWRDRQAELRVTEANVAGGKVQGEATLWPDLGSLFLAPQFTGVDAQRFFNTVGKPSDVLTGTATGGGKIYVEEWRRWVNPAFWDATLSLTVTNGVVRQVPILVRLWSAVSLQGLLRLQLPTLSAEGLAFSSLTGDLAFGHGLAVTNNISLDGSAVRIEAQGEIDLAEERVDLLVRLVLLHGITSALGWVPLVGDLLAHGTNLLTTLSFRVTGPYADPTVTPAVVDAVAG